MQLYLVTPDGSYVYNPEAHSLEQLSQKDLRKQLSLATQGQGAVADAQCDIVIAGSVRKIAAKYRNKAERFLLLEAGGIAENIQLQAVALGLASVPIGAFDTKNAAKACELPGDLEPAMIVCVGYPLAQQTPEKSKDESQSANKTVKSKKAVLITPAADFRDEELFETQRILNEAGISTAIASSKIGPLKGMMGGTAASELTIDKVRAPKISMPWSS